MRHPRPYRLWQRGNYFYYCLATGGRWRSTGKSTEINAHRFVIDLLSLRGGEETAKPSVSMRQYLDPFFIWDRCPHIRQLLNDR